MGVVWQRNIKGDMMAETPGQLPQGGAYQNIARIHVILDALAGAGNKGLRMTDVVRITGINKSAAHRALIGLSAYGLAAHNEDTSRFYLGDQLFAWVHNAPDRFALAERILPHINALADDVEDTINFSVRRGDYAVCYARAEGRSPVQFLTLRVGDSRPLGAGSGTLAIAAYLPEKERERLLETYDTERMQYGITRDMMRENLEATRRNGYAVHPGLIAKEMLGVAVPIRNSSGEAVASFSVVALRTRLQSPRLEQIVERLRLEAGKAEQALAALLDGV
jgi:Transcriptional regulator